MAIDTSIYGLVNPNALREGIAGIGQAYLQGEESRNRLAQLAEQSDINRMNKQKLQYEIDQLPALQAEKKRQQNEKIMQGISREIAQNPEGIDSILEKYSANADKLGVDPTHITWLASDLKNSPDIETMRDRAMYHANPAEYEKQMLEAKFRKNDKSSIQIGADENVYSVGSDNIAKPVMDTSGKQLKARPQAPLVQMGNPNWETKQDAAGNLVQINPKTGETRDLNIQGKGGEKALTEGQSKAYLFGTRAKDAHKILEGVGTPGTDYSQQKINTALTVENVPGVNVGANMLLTEKEQEVMQAQRNFINAILRQESGAAIGKSEFQNAAKQYFPQPGDTPEVIQRKAENRLRAIDGFRVASGPAASKFDKDLPTDQKKPAVAPYSDAEKERRYQEWKARQGK